MNDHELLLIDTSAWIVSFKAKANPEILSYIKSKIAIAFVATSPIIILELLQGCRTEKEKDELHAELSSLQILDLNDRVWDRAYDMGFGLKRKGITVPTVDLIIAALAIEYQCKLLHFNRHFKMIREQIPELDLLEISTLAH